MEALSTILFGISLLAQDLDVAVSRGGTMLDQVEDAGERRLFREIQREEDRVARRTKVTNFLRRYPASWLLAQVYEAGARASFELHDDATGLFYARESLRLYPENPLLTGTLSAVLANRGETQAARERARETLDYLDRFLAPSGMPARQWSEVRERLQKAATQVLGESPVTLVRPVKDPRSSYAGSAACAPCHQAQWERWKSTGMAKMLHHFEPGAVIGDFRRLHEDESAARGVVEGGKYFIELLRTGGRWDRFALDYVVGSKWQQAYATKSASGELHVLPVQFNRVAGKWINYWKMIDPPESARAEAGEFHRMRDVTSYQQNCAPCHTSQFAAKGFLEPGVNCEMCHGPAAAHVSGGPAKWSFRRMNHRDTVEVCAQCHAQSAIREPQAFPPRYQRRPYAEFSRKAFYRDGRFRETTFIVEAFERSGCFRKGEAHCGSCHDPHPANAAKNPASLKYAADSDQMCLQCHPAAYSAVGHTRHQEGEASRCVTCHMPKIMNSLLFAARSHQIDDRPRADTAARFGRQESPNACLSCHPSRDEPWLEKSLRAWGRKL